MPSVFTVDNVAKVINFLEAEIKEEREKAEVTRCENIKLRNDITEQKVYIDSLRSNIDSLVKVVSMLRREIDEHEGKKKKKFFF